MKKLELNLHHSVPIKSKNVYMHMLSIAMLNDTAADWMAETFIQTASYFPAPNYDVDPIFLLRSIGQNNYAYDYLTAGNGVCPLIDIYKYPYYDSIKNGMSASKFIKSKIQDGFYVLAKIDCSKITAYPYNEHFKEHSPLVFGYDDHSEIFMLNDYRTEHYGTFCATYSEIDNAFLSYVNNSKESSSTAKKISLGISCMHPNNIRYSFCIRKLIMECEDYLSGDCICPVYRQYIVDNLHFHYGITVYDIIKTVIMNLYDTQNLGTSIKFSHLIDFKTMMMMRLNYLRKYNYISTCDYANLECIARNSLSKARLIMMLYLKFSRTFDRELINRICELLMEMKLEDEMIIEKLLKILYHQ